MKKILLMLIPFTMTFAVIAQNPETKGTQTKKSSKQKKEAKSHTQATSVLDGKAFKITLTQKGDEMGMAPTVAPKNKETKDETSNASKAASTAQTREPVESPDLKQNQNQSSSFPDWNNAKGKLRFDDGMLKLALNSKDVATDNCKYNVTSGTSDLATFSAGCKLNSATALSDVGAAKPPADIGTSPASEKAKSISKAGRAENTTIENNAGDLNTAKVPIESKEMRESSDVASQSPKPDDRNATNKQPAARNMENANANPDVQPSNQNPSAMKDKEMTSQTQATAQLNITGFVNGNTISGTIVLYENGKMTNYSFNGTSTSKREPETLGMNRNK
jgi:hypothetical protein